jgi:hypothetical protein
MLKFINHIRIFCDVLVIAITSLSIFNIGWVLLAKNIYWPLYSKTANILGIVLFFNFFLFVPVLIWSNFKPVIRISTTVIVLATLYFELATTKIPNYVESATVNDKAIILGTYSLDNGSSCYQVLECKIDSTYCEKLPPQLEYCAIGNPGPESMLIDETGDLNIFVDGILVYTYKINYYKFEIEDLIFYKRYIYWAVGTKIDEGSLVIIGRCNDYAKDSCEIIQKHINPSFQKIKLEINDSDDELLIFYDGVLDRLNDE